MEGKGKISDYRSKLDRTLASPDLTNDEMVHDLVKNQILRSLDSQIGEYTEYAVERRRKQVSNFLSELRSASVNESKSSNESHSGWKVKQDTDELRVMYREGPEGTPFHTLLAEGYVDGPVDFCLCVSWESDLYKKWWPQITIPTFRVDSSQCLQKVRIGEQISLVRMKLTWPLSSREALVHYFAFEYFQDDLVVVLLNSISDLENIDRTTHGFTRDGIPDAEDVVRMDLFGGFALQKVTAERSYFRTIANMDIKLDFVPPALINFIARQLVGSGFKLYKKEVASVSKGDGEFREALKDPLYTRIREALYSQNASLASPASDNMRSTSIMLEERNSEAFKDNSARENNEIDDCVIDSEAKDIGVSGKKELNEIEEFEEKNADGRESLHEGTQRSIDNLNNEVAEKVGIDKMEVDNNNELERGHEITKHFGYDIKTQVQISPEVRQALRTLEKAISIFRGYNSNPGKGQSDVKKAHLLNLEDDAGEESISSEADEMRKKNGTCVESSKRESAELTSDAPRNSCENHGSRRKGSNSYTRETNQSKIAPASPDESHLSLSHIKHIDLLSSVNQENAPTVSENTTENHLLSAGANSVNGNRLSKKIKKKSSFCCLSFVSE